NEVKPEVSMLGAYPVFVTDGTSSPLESQQGLCEYASLSKEIKSLQNVLNNVCVWKAMTVKESSQLRNTTTTRVKLIIRVPKAKAIPPYTQINYSELASLFDAADLFVAAVHDIREDVAHVVQTLTGQGINVYLLSGDKKSSAEYVAYVVGIPKDQNGPCSLAQRTEIVALGNKLHKWCYMELNLIERPLKDRHVVAMVGDEINDVVALASSHVGVAIAGGVGAASEVALIVLTGNKISQYSSLALEELSLDHLETKLYD
ncbi:copper-transporting ATPase PAA1, chloroplastic, partial [Tanacetum coccineum]